MRSPVQLTSSDNSATRARTPQPATRDPRLVLAAVFLAALALRLYALDLRGLWYDEVASVDVAQHGLGAIFTDRFGWIHVQTPLYYLLVWLTIQPIDPASTTVLVRLPSVLAGALATVVTYGLGKELFGRRQGLLAAAILALAATPISYSQDARPYALLTLFTALSAYCLLVALRTASPSWWALFAAATTLNLYLTYFALTLALPALLLCLAWLLFRAARPPTNVDTPDSSPRRNRLRYPLIAFGVIALACLPLLLDLSGIPRNAPDLSRLSPDLVTSQVTLLPGQLARLGIGGTPELWLQWLFGVLALVGAGFALARGKLSGAILSVSFVLVPAVLLAVLRTSNTVFQRYALFAAPFYFLLIANGVLSLWQWPGLRSGAPGIPRLGMTLSAALLLALFSYSAYVYFDPSQYRTFHSQPDYRGIAAYLQVVARPADKIVLVDEPALGWTVLDFYWHHKPPASAFDVRDPRLCGPSGAGCGAPGGTVYQLTTFFPTYPGFLDTYVQSSTGTGKPWRDPVYFERAVVMAGDRAEPNLPAMQAVNPSAQALLTLQGALAQAAGDAPSAAGYFRAAGAYFSSGDEYLRTAQGFFDRGDLTRAWREANISKFMQPDSPAIHDWMAARLAEEGFALQSELEEQIAAQLRQTP